MQRKVRAKWPVLLRRVMLIICGTALGIGVYMTNASKVVGNQLPTPFGYGAAVVLSGSMEPEFSAGDLIIVKEDDNYDVKDIVVYQDGNHLVVHRIIAKSGQEIITKGDANNVPDHPIQMNAVKGKVLFEIPCAGILIQLLQTPAGIIGMIAAAIALIEIPNYREREKDEKERQKLMDEIRQLKKEQEKQ